MTIPHAIRRLVLLGLVMIGGSGMAAAQSTVTNPTTVQFDISADDATLVVRYDLLIYRVSDLTTVVRTVTLGKPTPSAGVDTGDPGCPFMISVDFSVLTSWPLPNGTYQARVVAVGSSGQGVSDLSNIFDFATTIPPTCSYGVSPTSGTVPAGGGTVTLAIAASPSTCAWAATSDSLWATLSAPSGVGVGAVTVTVAANTGTGRTATLLVAGTTVTITQAAVACGYTLSTALLAVGATGGESLVTLTPTLPTCTWTVTNPAAWLTVTPMSGTGTSDLRVTVSANTGAVRQASVVIGWQTLAVIQAAATGGAPPQAPQNVIIK